MPGVRPLSAPRGQAVSSSSIEEGGWQTLSASNLPHDPAERAPREMTTQDLARVKQGFVDSALRAVALGIELEIHAAHGYLLHQFLSPLSNQRSDEYGGSLDNRMRFPLEVFRAVREAVPSAVAVGIRISATDWVEGGWDLAQSTALTQKIEAAGGDYVHVSSGGLSPLQSIKVTAGYQVPFAKALREQTRMPVIAVGLITEPQHAESILQQGEADLIALGTWRALRSPLAVACRSSAAWRCAHCAAIPTRRAAWRERHGEITRQYRLNVSPPSLGGLTVTHLTHQIRCFQKTASSTPSPRFLPCRSISSIIVSRLIDLRSATSANHCCANG